MTSIQLLALGLLCEGLIVRPTFATTITGTFNSSAGLDLVGDFHSAVNFSGTGETINGLSFTAMPIPTTLFGSEVGPVDNVTVQSLSNPGRVRDPGGSVSANFGDAQLDAISETVVLSNGGGVGGPNSGLGTIMGIEILSLIPGQQYKAQFLFFDVFQSFSPTRVFEINIEGNTEIGMFDIFAITGMDNTVGVLVTHEFTGPADGILDIHLIPNDFTSGFSPIISALTVEVVPEPSTMLLLGFGLAGLGFFGRRKIAV